MKQTKSKGQRSGSLALEAAVILPVVLMIMAFMYNILTAAIAETRLNAAMDRTASELSLVVPLCDMVLSRIDAGSEMTQHSAEQQRQKQMANIIDFAGSQLWPGFSAEEILADAALDLASSALLGPYIQQRINYWLEQADSISSAFNGQIVNRKLFLDFKVGNQQLWLCQSYEIKTVLGNIRRQSNVVVPLWIGSGGQSPGNIDGIWELDNLSRGQIIRQHLAAGLPYDFPVIADFREGRAISICSMDLTAPTYRNADNIIVKIESRIARLASFNGTVYTRKDKQIAIAASDIRTRELKVVIPGNSPASGMEALQTLESFAASRGVNLELITLGHSSRYGNEGQ